MVNWDEKKKILHLQDSPLESWKVSRHKTSDSEIIKEANKDNK